MNETIIPGAGETTMDDCVYGLAAVPALAAEGIFFAARASGLYGSTDGGATWRSLYSALALPGPLPTAAVAASPTFTHDGHLFAGVAGAVMRSADQGRTWQAINLASPAPTVTALAVSPDYERDGVIFAGTAEDGVFRSRDRGVRWGAWNFGLLDLNTLCLALSPDYAHDQTLFVGTESGIFRSTNGGRAWRDLEFSEDHAPVQCLAVSSAYREDGLLMVGTESCGLFISRDWGETWDRSTADAITGPVIGVAITPAGDRQRWIVATEEAVLRSDDGGASWEPLLSGPLLSGPLLSGPDTLFTVLAAPAALGAHATILVGTIDGRVVQKTISA